MLFLIALILAAVAGYGVAIAWGRGIAPTVAAGVGAGIALLTMIVFDVFVVGGVLVKLLAVAAGAVTVYAVRDRDFGISAGAKTPEATAGGRRPVAFSTASGGGSARPAPDRQPPSPDHYSSDEEAGAALNAVGDLQRRYESGAMRTDEIAVMGEDISRKCQGVVNYFVSQGKEGNLYKSSSNPSAPGP